jgi:hypothetical protein
MSNELIVAIITGVANGLAIGLYSLVFVLIANELR